MCLRYYADLIDMADEEKKQKRLAAARDWKARNKSRVQEYRKRYFRDNKDVERANNVRFFEENPGYKAEANRRYVSNNVDKIRTARAMPDTKAKRNERERRRYATDPEYCVQKRIRASVTQAIRKALVGKSAGTFDLVGCTPKELREHLESKFLPGMSWDRRSEIHIDHIRPVSSFDMADPEQQRACFHYANLQPLWKADNLKKGAKYLISI